MTTRRSFLRGMGALVALPLMESLVPTRTLRAAERVVGQSLDRSAHQRLIDEVMVNSDFGRDASN